MKKKGFSAEQIIGKLREAEVLLSQGSTVGEVSRKLGVTEQTIDGGGNTGDAGRAGSKAQRAGEGEREAQETGGGSDPGQGDSQVGDRGKLLSPSRRYKAVRWVCESLRISQRRACRVLGQARSTQRQAREVSGKEERLVAGIIALATRYGRYGYRRITVLLRAEGWRVNHKRMERIWRQEGLKGPQKQPKRERLWLDEGSCIRLSPQRKNHNWSYDLMAARTQGGRAFRILTILDEYTRECLGITVARRITAQGVIYQLGELFLERGIPEHIRSDNGPEFTARAIRQWLKDLGVKTPYIKSVKVRT